MSTPIPNRRSGAASFVPQSPHSVMADEARGEPGPIIPVFSVGQGIEPSGSNVGGRQARYFTRSAVVSDYKAAGVLPLTIVPGGQPFVLLGGEPTRTGPKGSVRRLMWGDFGGHREAIDEGCSIATASREFAEETLGMFWSPLVNKESVAASMQSMVECLSGDATFHVTHKLRKGTYRMYVAQTPYVDPMFFHLATQTNLVTGAVPGGEKTAFAWVPLPDLLTAVSDARKSYFLDHNARRRAISGAFYSGGIQLHPCFATTMRLAMAEGLAECVASAQAIAASTRASIEPALQRPFVAGTRVPDKRSSSPLLQESQHESSGASFKKRRHRSRGANRSDDISGTTPLGPKHIMYWLSQDGVRSRLLAAR